MSANCIHHWLITTPDGNKEVPGECRHCGEVRHFVAGMWDTPNSKAAHEQQERARQRSAEARRRATA